MDYRCIDRCRGCHGQELDSVLEMQPMPLAGLYCESQEEARGVPVFPLTWVKCRHCGLVQVQEEISDDLLFAQYSYASSTVGGLVRHFDEYAKVLAARYTATSQLEFLEIGCNDGVLLNRLPSSWALYGVDPSDVARSGPGAGARYELMNEPFSAKVVDRERLQGRFDVVSGSNCLAHISDLRDVFQGVHRALKDGGHFWLEVHDLDALLGTGQWDTIYHEHKVEWSQASLSRCMQSVGFSQVAVWKLPLHGGCLRACYKKDSRPQCIGGPVPFEAGLEGLRTSYERRYDSPAAKALTHAQDIGKEIVAYGASGRANVYLNQLLHLDFAYVVDESPLRAGRYMPRVATPIVNRERFQGDSMEICLITAWNYADDIKSRNRFKGKWLTAFHQV